MSIQYYLKSYHSFFPQNLKVFKRMFNIKTILTEWNSVAGITPEEAQIRKLACDIRVYCSHHHYSKSAQPTQFYSASKAVMPSGSDLLYGAMDGLLLRTPKDCKFLSTLTWLRSMIDVSSD